MKTFKDVKNWVEEHKKQILIGIGGVGAAATGVFLFKKVPMWRDHPYKLTVRFSNKVHLEAFKEYFFTDGAVSKVDDGTLWVNIKSERMFEEINKLVANEPEERLYKFVVQKLPMDVTEG